MDAYKRASLPWPLASPRGFSGVKSLRVKDVGVQAFLSLQLGSVECLWFLGFGKKAFSGKFSTPKCCVATVGTNPQKATT